MAIIYSIGTHCSNVETVKQRSLKILCFCHPQGWWLLLHVNDHLDFERYQNPTHNSVPCVQSSSYNLLVARHTHPELAKGL